MLTQPAKPSPLRSWCLINWSKFCELLSSSLGDLCFVTITPLFSGRQRRNALLTLTWLFSLFFLISKKTQVVVMNQNFITVMKVPWSLCITWSQSHRQKWGFGYFWWKWELVLGGFNGWMPSTHQHYSLAPLCSMAGERKYNDKFMSWDKDKDRSLTDYCHGQNRLELETWIEFFTNKIRQGYKKVK